MFLFRAVVFTLSGYAHSENIAIKLEARFGVRYRDRRVIDTEEESAARFVPLGRSLVLGKFQNLHGMLVGILEIERLDARGVFIPIGQSLWSGRSVLDAIFTQHPIGPVHVADDDGNVLKPKIVAARI